MVQETFTANKTGAVSKINLSAVTTATNGASVGTRDYTQLTFFVNVSGNTGAVTVNLEVSPDASTWFSLRAETYIATNQKDVFSYKSHFPFARTTTTTQSTSTVTTNITGGR